MLGRLEYDALEVFGLDVAIAILVEQQESLANALALESSEHLRELGVCQTVSFSLVADIELCPLTIPIEGDGLGSLVLLIQAAEVFVFDTSDTLDIEKTECDLILCIWLDQEVFEGRPVAKRDLASPCAVGDIEKETILFPFDFRLW